MNRNQNGQTAIYVIVGVIVLCVIAYLVFNSFRQRTAKLIAPPARPAAEIISAADMEAAKKKDAEEAQRKSRGSACLNGIKYMSEASRKYSAEHGAFPVSLENLADFDAHVREIMDDQEIWNPNNALSIDSFFNEKFVLTGYCMDGRKYEFSSETDRTEATAY